jgi:hypothetical protein
MMPLVPCSPRLAAPDGDEEMPTRRIEIEPVSDDLWEEMETVPGLSYGELEDVRAGLPR